MDEKFRALRERMDYYLAKAAEADEKLLATKNPIDRETWRQIAASWRDLAAQVKSSSR
jgi:hypothetical protein